MGSLINGDVYKAHKWIRKVIKSCNTLSHINNCDRLVANFGKLYDHDVLLRDLEMHLVDKLLYIIPTSYFEEVTKGEYLNKLDYIYETE